MRTQGLLELIPQRRWTVLASAAALTALTACSPRDDDPTVGQRVDRGIATAENKTERAADTVERKAEQAGRAIEQGGQQMADATTNASLTAAVKAALLTAPDLGSLQINVDSNDGVVTLRGEVKTSAEKTHAEQVASNVAGVQSVVNDLRISS
jgi:hyperosmotically inducible periplasmic protein